MKVDGAMWRAWLAALLAVAMGCGGVDDDGGGPGGEDGGVGESRTIEVTTWIGSSQEAPLWAAAQDGDGAWQVVESGDGVHAFEVTSGRYGFVFYCDDSRGYAFFSTVEEAEQVNRGCQGGYDANPAVRVAVEGLAEGELAWVGLGPNWSGQATAGVPAELFVPAGVHDLIITVQDDTGAPRAILVERDVEVREGEDLELTFDAADAVDAPQAHSIGIDGYPHLTTVWVNLATADGSLGQLGGYSFNAYSELDGMYGGYPGADATDLYRIWIDGTSGGFPAEYRFIGDPQDLELTAPEEFTLADASFAATTPTVRLQSTFTARPGAAYSLYFQPTDPPFQSMDVYISAGWLADRIGTFTWEQPDFTGLDGWDPAWAFDAVGVDVSAVEMVGDLDPLIVLPQFPPDRKVPYPAELAGTSVTMAPATAMFVP